MRIDQFDFFLPEHLIAQSPVTPAHNSRLLIYNKKLDQVSDCQFWKICEFLGENDVLVLNNSRVIPARLLFHKNNKEFEIFFVKQISVFDWLVMLRPGKKFKIDEIFTIESLDVKLLKRNDDGTYLISINKNVNELAYFLEKYGQAPLPPYIKNYSEALAKRYQNVFAKKDGSAAVPTAALHFTKEMLNKLLQKGVQIEYVTLHVGLGTFKPITEVLLNNHKMHSEMFEIDFFTAKRLNAAKQSGKRIIAVGTTSIRVLETISNRFGKIIGGQFETDIFIKPGYKFSFIDASITNFHLPKSSLLILVSALVGRKKALDLYNYAIRKSFRFFSFGDAMFIY